MVISNAIPATTAAGASKLRPFTTQARGALQLQWSQQRPTLHFHYNPMPFPACTTLYEALLLYSLRSLCNTRRSCSSIFRSTSATLQPRLHQPSKMYNQYHHFKKSARVKKTKPKKHRATRSPVDPQQLRVM